MDNLNVVGIGADGESSRRGSSLIVVAHVGEIAHRTLLDSDIVRGSHEEERWVNGKELWEGLLLSSRPPLGLYTEIFRF
jgi:hypothetical protein